MFGNYISNNISDDVSKSEAAAFKKQIDMQLLSSNPDIVSVSTQLDEHGHPHIFIGTTKPSSGIPTEYVFTSAETGTQKRIPVKTDVVGDIVASDLKNKM